MAALPILIVSVIIVLCINSGSALHCYECGSIMNVKGACDNLANKKHITLTKCEPNVDKCFTLETSSGIAVSRGCLTGAERYFCNGIGSCRTCHGDLCNGDQYLSKGMYKLFKYFGYSNKGNGIFE